MKSLRVTTLALLVSLVACTDEEPCPSNATALSACPPVGQTITLTATQAAALVSRIESFGSTDPTLEALADTVDIVIKTGAEARRVEITNDAGSSTFYAVSLATRNTLNSPATTAFNIIAFNDPTNPTLFVILGGWKQGTGSTPPNDVSGSIGAEIAGQSLTAHLFSVTGNQTSAWHASQGTSSMLVSITTGACNGFAGPGSCAQSSMTASFQITGTVAGTGTSGQRTFSGTIANIPGISVTM